MSKNSSGTPVIRTMAPADIDRVVEIDIKVLGKPRPEYWEMKFELVGKRSQISSLVAESDGKMHHSEDIEIVLTFKSKHTRFN